jgi:hypothetical protein
MLKSVRRTLVISGNALTLNVGNRERVGGGRRKKVAGMSKRSASALMRFINSIEFSAVSFVTLTYRYNQVDCEQGYKDLRAWYRKLSNDVGPRCVVWKVERQERGAVHYHLFVIDATDGWSRERMVDAWMSVTGQDGDTAARKYGVAVSDFGVLGASDMGVVVAYMAKYTAKRGAATDGKAWGILGRKNCKEHKRSVEVDKVTGDAIAAQIVGMGGKILSTDGGGSVYRLYLGHMGAIAGGVISSGDFAHLALPDLLEYYLAAHTFTDVAQSYTDYADECRTLKRTRNGDFLQSSFEWEIPGEGQ